MSEHIINSSLIKQFLFKGDVKEHCPKKIYEYTIKKNYSDVTRPQLLGLFFESLCLGSCADGQTQITLEKKKLTKTQKKENRLAEIEGRPHPHVGEPYIEEIRIEEQYSIFKKECLKHDIKIIKSGEYKNVQNTIYKKLTFSNDIIMVSGTLDMFPIRIKLSNNHLFSVIDLKTTNDIHSTFREFGWGNAKFMDHIQAHMYIDLLQNIDYQLNPHIKKILSSEDIENLFKNNYYFFYWIFDYKPELENELKIVEYDKIKQQELYESIRKTNSMIDYYNKTGWTTNPIYKLCKNCLVPCPDKSNIERL